MNTDLSRSYIIDGVNPIPWSAGGYSRGSKRMVKSQPLIVYQQSLKEELADQVSGLWPQGLPIYLRFEFWRQLEAPVDTTGRKHQAQYADATNLQKSTEDALQGVLFSNDRYVTEVHTLIRAQGSDVEPKVIIHISEGPTPWESNPSAGK